MRQVTIQKKNKIIPFYRSFTLLTPINHHAKDETIIQS